MIKNQTRTLFSSSCLTSIYSTSVPKLLYLTLRKKCPYSELFWSECGKIRTRITPNKGTFYAVLFFTDPILALTQPNFLFVPLSESFKSPFWERTKFTHFLKTSSQFLYVTNFFHLKCWKQQLNSFF